MAEPGRRGSGSKTPHELPGLKSRGGEKVKQTFSAPSREPQSGGLQGDAVYTDLGFGTRLNDVLCGCLIFHRGIR